MSTATDRRDGAIRTRNRPAVPGAPFIPELDKAQPGGVATLDGSTSLIPTGQLGTGVPDATKALFGDQTWQAAATAAALTAETNARTAADAAEAATRAAADTTLQTNITNEAATRAANDTTETNARVAADTAESTARANADTTLQTNINTEATTRANADTTEATTRANADTTESAARVTHQNLTNTAHGGVAGTTASTGSGVAVAFGNVGSSGMWLVRVKGNGFSATQVVLLSHNGGGWVGATLLTNGLIVIGVDGSNNLTVTQNDGVAHTMDFSYRPL